MHRGLSVRVEKSSLQEEAIEVFAFVCLEEREGEGGEGGGACLFAWAALSPR